MMRQRSFRPVLAALALLGGLCSAAQAYPVYSRYYRLRYQDQGGCNICHQEGGGTKRNPYGEEWQRSGESLEAFASIEQRDSDGDGASNRDEIKGGSNPGDPTSTLARPGYKWHLRHGVPIPVEQMRHALGNAPDFGFREVDLSRSQLKSLETLAGRPLRPDERYPTLYYALQRGRRTGATALFIYPEIPAGRAALLIGLDPAGKVRKLFLLRAGESDLKLHRSFIECLERSPLPGTGDPPSCAPAKGQEATGRGILKALQLALATVAQLSAEATASGGD